VQDANVNGMDVSGFSTEAVVTLSGSQGSCHDGTFRAKQLVYFAQMSEPVRQAKPAPIDTLALPNGCAATMQRQVSGAADPVGLMYVYRLITVTRDPNTATQQGSNAMPAMPPMPMMGSQPGLPDNYLQLSQRGNIRHLTSADASLFAVPPGYRQG
jgi:hypothetical protein